MKELLWIEMPKKWFKLEKDFTTYFLWELKKKWFWKKKWSDWNFDLKPYDCNIVTNVWSYHTEIKIIKKDEIGMNNLRANQHKSLEHIALLWWKAIIIIYSVHFNKYMIFEYLDFINKFWKK